MALGAAVRGSAAGSSSCAFLFLSRATSSLERTGLALREDERPRLHYFARGGSEQHDGFGSMRDATQIHFCFGFRISRVKFDANHKRNLVP